jgi:ABC transporter substrate binding protein
VNFERREIAASEAGGLMAYAPSSFTIFRRSASYIDKILKGTKPDELPVEVPTRFELDINLKTAKEIGLTISPRIPCPCGQADRIIRPMSEFDAVDGSSTGTEVPCMWVLLRAPRFGGAKHASGHVRVASAQARPYRPTAAKPVPCGIE